MVLRTTRKVDSRRFGALVVEEGEGSGENTTRVPTWVHGGDGVI